MSVALSHIVHEAEELLRESRNFPHFIEPEDLLSVYPFSTQSHAKPVHYLAPCLFKVHCIIILPYSLVLHVVSAISVFLPKYHKHFFCTVIK